MKEPSVLARHGSWMRRVALLASLPLLALGCAALTGPDTAGIARLSFAASIAVAPSQVGTIDPRYVLELRSFYERTGGSRVEIGNERITLSSATTQTQPVSLTLDVASCLLDERRTPAGPGCPVRIALLLRLVGTGITLDYQFLGPFALVSGERKALADKVAVAQIVFLDVWPSSPTIVVGGTVALHARFFTVVGDTVRRPVEWRTETPSIASVDAAGIVTGLAPGRATIVAHWGEGQSAAGQYVTVNASSTSVSALSMLGGGYR